MAQEYDEQLLMDYANNFLGYGELDSPLWLVGPEAGGGQTIAEVYKRATVWADRGRQETEDLQDYHKAIGIDWSSNIQSTWGPLIRIALAARGNLAVNTKDVKEFQKNELGKLGGRNAVLDLSQLSSPSASHWDMSEFEFSWLSTREDYEANVLAARCQKFHELIAHYHPRLVIFYGSGHLPYWERIAKSQFRLSSVPRLYCAVGEKSLFALVPHPLAVRNPGRGSNNRYFADVGAALRKGLN